MGSFLLTYWIFGMAVVAFVGRLGIQQRHLNQRLDHLEKVVEPGLRQSIRPGRAA